MLKWIVLGLIAIGLLTSWLINMDFFSGKEANSVTKKLSSVQEAVNECINISEKSVAHLKEQLEFQRLEKIGRQARVMRLCMADHGFQQSDEWTQFAKLKAVDIAQETQISTDEAFENLRRQHMILLTPPSKTPPYWIPAK